MSKNRYSKKKKCLDCGVLVENRSTRCYKCSAGLRKVTFPKCETCGKTLSRKFHAITKKPVRFCINHRQMTEEHKKNIGLGSKGRVFSEENKKKMSINITKIWKERRKLYFEDLTKKKEYYRAVRRITKRQKVEVLENYRKEGYELDHITPIIEGYRRQIDPKIVGDISNLRYIPASENRRLGSQQQMKWRLW
jgi:hypothetical protein